jgi:DNA-binding response OmpR family regulator
MEADATILIVEDEPNVLGCIQRLLEIAGYEAIPAKDGIEALQILESTHIDIILADIAMPRMNGYQLYERVIGDPRWVAIPFVFLTARALDSDIRYGKQLGVDDYLTKPFTNEDLLVTVRGRLRRARQLASVLPAVAAPSHADPDTLVVGDLRIDLGRHRAWRGERAVPLSGREFRLLSCLAQQSKAVVSLEALIQATHGLETDRVEAGSLLRPLIRSLRRKLGYPVGEMGCIENVRGVGYTLMPPFG